MLKLRWYEKSNFKIDSSSKNFFFFSFFLFNEENPYY
jgi:hypothetical protein